MNEGALHIYKSSAGSGKTYTLVKTYLEILISSDDLFKFSKILAITFTNKAANEMKERVIDALEVLSLNKDPKYVEEFTKTTGLNKEQIVSKSGQLLKTILHNYSDFNILTIDKFTHRLIRSFSRELGLTSNFDLQIDRREFYERGQAEILNEIGSDNELTATLIDYYKRQITEFEAPSIDYELDQLKKLRGLDKNNSFFEAYFKHKFKDFKEAETTLVQETKTLKTDILESSKHIYNSIHSDIRDNLGHSKNISKWLNKLANSKIDIPSKSIMERISDRNFVSGALKKKFPEACDQLESDSSLLEAFDELTLKINTFFFLKKASTQVLILAVLVQIEKRLEQIKSEQNVMFLGDFNKLISGIIKSESAPFIYERIGARFEHYFVDEFQDTSTLQWNNMIPLIYDSLSSENLNLLVGDAKQSIYRFRGGDVNQFVNLPKVEGEIKDLDLINKTFEYQKNVSFLDKNWRSDSSIIEFNNWLYPQIGARYQGVVANIYEDVQQNITSTQPGYVKITVPEGLDSDTKEEFAASEILQNVSDCLEAGFKPNQITFLVDTKRIGSKVSTVLIENNFQVQSIDSIVLGYSQEVKRIVSFAKAILERHEENLIRCLFLELESDQVTQKFEELRIPDIEKPYYSRNYKWTSFFNEFLPDISLKEYESLNIFEKVNEIINCLDINRTNPFVDKLLNVAFDYQRQRNASMDGFLNHIDSKKDEISVNVGQDENAIQVMTIHKSKGLQFEVVIIPYLPSSGKVDKVWGSHESFEKSGLAKLPVNLKSYKTVSTEKDVEAEEEMTQLDVVNKVYVATTRAKHRMYISAFENGGKNIDIQKHLITLFKNHPNYDADSGIIEIGSPNPFEQKEKVEIPKITMKPIQNWKSLDLKMSFTSQAFSDDYDTIDERELGDFVHNVLSKCKSTQEIGTQWNKVKTSFSASIQLKNKAELMLVALQKENTICKLINQVESVITERAIVTEEGKIIKPDRINILNDRILLFDYKTGSKDKKHINQINEYAQELMKIFQRPIDKYLIYLSTNQSELVHVR